MRSVASGEAVIDAAIAGRVMAELRSEGQPAVEEEPLAERDLEILRLVTQGKSNQEIADKLFLAEKTVRNWRHRGVGPPAIRCEGAVRYRADDLEGWVASQTGQVRE